MKIDPATVRRTAKIAASLAKAVRDYIRDDQKAAYPLPRPVTAVIRCPRMSARLADGFEHLTSDGSLLVKKMPDGRILLRAGAFPRSANLWNGPDLLKNNEIASMTASLFHDLVWVHHEELAAAFGCSERDVLKFGNDAFPLVWRYVDPSLKGRVKSWIAFQAVSAAAPWYHKAKKALGAIALGALLAGGCTGCASFPEGGVDELDGVDAVEEVMSDYGDGLGPDPAPANP